MYPVAFVVLALAAIANAQNPEECTDKKNKPYTNFLIHVFGYIIAPAKANRAALLEAGPKLKATEQDTLKVAKGCGGVSVELWEEDAKADEQTCGEDETGNPKKVGQEKTKTAENGFFHLAGIAQECGDDVEGFIRVDATGDHAPTTCGDFDSQSTTKGRWRVSIPDKPYGTLVAPKRALDDLKLVDDEGKKVMDKAFYFGRLNLNLVEYWNEAHDDKAFKQDVLEARIEYHCKATDLAYKGHDKKTDVKAITWMKPAIDAEKKKDADKAKAAGGN